MSKPAWNRLLIFFAFIMLLFFPENSKAESKLIPDQNLEAAVRTELNLLQKSLEEADLQKLDSLYLSDPTQKVQSLEGMQYAANLNTLIVPGHQLQQIEPLHGLNKLSFLVLSGNDISDIQPLADLVSLRRLLLDGNEIEHIEPLSGLTNLTDLLIGNNNIKQISALQGLPLRWVDLSNNQIEDLTPLQKVASLETLYAGNNQIRNIDVLLELPKLKEVHLENNPLDEHAASVINALKNKGVKVQTVKEDKQKEQQDIRVSLDANTVPFSAPPFIANGTTFVPFRPVFDRLGIEISWDEATRTIQGKKEGIQIELQLDNPVAVVIGKEVTLPAAPVLVDGSTFVPVRFISEAVEAQVEWDAERRIVIINSKKQFATKDGKIRFTAYGLWRDLSSMMEMDDTTQLAIRYFNYTELYIYAHPKSVVDPASKDLQRQYLELLKQELLIDKESIIEEKQTKALGFDALQLTYVNNNDWDKRIDTILVFEANSQFYTIINSSYEVTYKESSKQFQEILGGMTFRAS
ncbi:stalk domain-containing protein [Paenibacillus sp. NPDC056579]|uniref:stalk domain-containing protein n=1 Tax=Paenibacillus sp. NPDC056579 TaxID=3345871 RepID=UPI00369E525C